MPPAPPAEPALPLAPLAFAAALLPVLAVLAAWTLSTQQGLIPVCLPFVDGCVSVSRAARHGLANHVFRALMLPAAVLQALTWIVAARWLAAHGDTGRARRWLAPLGLAAAVALVLYGSFLGTEGPVYRALRRNGTAVWFGFTCIALLLLAQCVQRRADAGAWALGNAARRALHLLGGLLVALGLANAFAALFAAPALANRIENVAEWWGAAILMTGFAAIGLLWHRTGAALRFRA
jgi:hypothetical protein